MKGFKFLGIILFGLLILTPKAQGQPVDRIGNVVLKGNNLNLVHFRNNGGSWDPITPIPIQDDAYLIDPESNDTCEVIAKGGLGSDTTKIGYLKIPIPSTRNSWCLPAFTLHDSDSSEFYLNLANLSGAGTGSIYCFLRKNSGEAEFCNITPSTTKTVAGITRTSFNGINSQNLKLQPNDKIKTEFLQQSSYPDSLLRAIWPQTGYVIIPVDSFHLGTVSLDSSMMRCVMP